MHVGLGPSICWVGPIDMLGWAHLYVGLGSLYLYVGLGIVLMVLLFKDFQVLSVPKGRTRLECTASLDDYFHNDYF